MKRAPLTANRRPRAPWPVIIFCAIATLVSASVARAARPERDRRAAAKAEVQKAQVNYKLGRFDDALDAYARAYEMFNAPALLFNIGQCHKNLKNYDRAIFFFEGYLREEAKADPRKRRLAEDLIAESRAEQEKVRLAEVEARLAAPPPAVTLRTPPPRVPPQAPILVDEPSNADEQENRDTPLLRKAWFWTAVGAGAILVGGGALAYYFSGPTTTVLPGGTVGTLDRR